MDGDLDIRMDDGCRLHARVEGSGDRGAPWVVFANSILTDLMVWDAQVSVVGRHFRILRYDQRGHGASDVPAGPLTFERLGADLIALMDRCEIESAHIVGLSMGVPTGLAAAAVVPDRLRSFVCVDGLAANRPAAEAFWSDRQQAAREAGMDALAEATVARWLKPGDDRTDTGGRLHRMIASTPLDGFVAAASALKAYDCSATALALGCPVLAISGERDTAIAEGMQRDFGGVTDIRFASVDDAGHLPNYEQPDAFNALLLPFLREVD